MHQYNTYNCIHDWKPIHGHYIRLSQTPIPHLMENTPPTISYSSVWKICTLNISLFVVFHFLIYINKYIYNISHTQFLNSRQVSLLYQNSCSESTYCIHIVSKGNRRRKIVVYISVWLCGWCVLQLDAHLVFICTQISACLIFGWGGNGQAIPVQIPHTRSSLACRYVWLLRKHFVRQPDR